jgi:hypothetical protein
MVMSKFGFKDKGLVIELIVGRLIVFLFGAPVLAPRDFVLKKSSHCFPASSPSDHQTQ